MWLEVTSKNIGTPEIEDRLRSLKPVVPWIFLLSHHLSKKAFPLKDTGKPKLCYVTASKVHSSKFPACFQLSSENTWTYKLSQIPIHRNTEAALGHAQKKPCVGVSSWKLKTHFSEVTATSLSRLSWTCEADFTNHELFPFTWSWVKLLWKMGNTQISFSACGNQSYTYNFYHSCVYFAMKMLHGYNSLNFPNRFALLVHSCPFFIFIFF